ncbi:hypothetical protein [Ancylomarina sp. 16SWW S1-10-2]|uniref:hypothetical protein n=1 Tax=Ancylomarina sp. 16SWW S1-10-2 TaxID=2499681 RepID=UPI0012AEAE9B|nr:hypothetical protein [Ancylomarina sp. 16SWW S1-10-2]MRT92828.1 hypothetical protein [Ancylomarina sp. 16SWW S1-10-2]
MIDLSAIHKQMSREELIAELVRLFTPYAKNLLTSGGDFSYMNMYADNFSEQLQNLSQFNEYDIFNILNEACDTSWRVAVRR